MSQVLYIVRRKSDSKYWTGHDWVNADTDAARYVYNEIPAVIDGAFFAHSTRMRYMRSGADKLIPVADVIGVLS